MNPLAQQTCANHAGREAAARCPECGEYCCRECVTEHDGRVICAACLKRLARDAQKRRPGLSALRQISTALLGLVTASLFFYWTGRILLRIPAEYHDGTVWTEFYED